MNFDDVKFGAIPKAHQSAFTIDLLRQIDLRIGLVAPSTPTATPRKSLLDRIRSPEPADESVDDANDSSDMDIDVSLPDDDTSHSPPALAKRITDPAATTVMATAANRSLPSPAASSRRASPHVDDSVGDDEPFGTLYAEAMKISSEWASHADSLKQQRESVPSEPLRKRTKLADGFTSTLSTAFPKLAEGATFPAVPPSYIMPSNAAPFKGLASAGTKETAAATRPVPLGISPTPSSETPMPPPALAPPTPSTPGHVPMESSETPVFAGTKRKHEQSQPPAAPLVPEALQAPIPFKSSEEQVQQPQATPVARRPMPFKMKGPPPPIDTSRPARSNIGPQRSMLPLQHATSVIAPAPAKAPTVASNVVQPEVRVKTEPVDDQLKLSITELAKQPPQPKPEVQTPAVPVGASSRRVSASVASPTTAGKPASPTTRKPVLVPAPVSAGLPPKPASGNESTSSVSSTPTQLAHPLPSPPSRKASGVPSPHNKPLPPSSQKMPVRLAQLGPPTPSVTALTPAPAPSAPTPAPASIHAVPAPIHAAPALPTMVQGVASVFPPAVQSETQPKPVQPLTLTQQAPQPKHTISPVSASLGSRIFPPKATQGPEPASITRRSPNEPPPHIPNLLVRMQDAESSRRGKRPLESAEPDGPRKAQKRQSGGGPLDGNSLAARLGQTQAQTSERPSLVERLNVNVQEERRSRPRSPPPTLAARFGMHHDDITDGSESLRSRSPRRSRSPKYDDEFEDERMHNRRLSPSPAPSPPPPPAPVQVQAKSHAKSPVQERRVIYERSPSPAPRAPVSRKRRSDARAHPYARPPADTYRPQVDTYRPSADSYRPADDYRPPPHAPSRGRGRGRGGGGVKSSLLKRMGQ